MSESYAFTRGRDAYAAGGLSARCPYDTGSQSARQWTDGWANGERHGVAVAVAQKAPEALAAKRVVFTVKNGHVVFMEDNRITYQGSLDAAPDHVQIAIQGRVCGAQPRATGRTSHRAPNLPVRDETTPGWAEPEKPAGPDLSGVKATLSRAGRRLENAANNVASARSELRSADRALAAVS